MPNIRNREIYRRLMTVYLTKKRFVYKIQVMCNDISPYCESEVIELKERCFDTVMKENVSFLNTEGEMLIIGVKDNAAVIGVEKPDETPK